MRLLVVGANGGLGRQVVGRALENGHRVTAFVRHAGSLPAHRDLTVVPGAVADQPDRVRQAVAGHDAVLSALGNPLWLKGNRGPAIVARAAANMVAAMREEGVERIVMPLAWGTGASAHHSSSLVRAVTRTLIRRDFRDFDAAEHLLAGSGLSWTIAYFGALTDAPPGHGWTASPDLRTPHSLAIARADVAQFLLEAVEQDRYAGARAVLSGPTRANNRKADWHDR